MMSSSVEKAEGASVDADHRASPTNAKREQGLSSSRGSLSGGDDYDSKEDKRLLRKIDGRFDDLFCSFDHRD